MLEKKWSLLLLLLLFLLHLLLLLFYQSISFLLWFPVAAEAAIKCKEQFLLRCFLPI